MSPEQRELARHALGLPNKRRESFRNHYAIDAGCPDHDLWLAMVAAGEARRRANVAWMGGMDQFWLTRSGAESALEPKERLDPEDFPDPSTKGPSDER